ncbi:pre-mRNA-splicing factor CWC26 [Diplogelasinospora grovesii]|uniref:Pre-mRNA-splicing factor CWC26 n=1 Tax=Diplogelasinospora grovesii TaxID=303347 RepID=A0AAN6NAD4_9PEZI|nr:pre-mRNA-splicing factor CWC26 [Diplogelasinospora grovesii]
MPSDKAAYLAQHYLTADSKSSSSSSGKKRKRKGGTKNDGLLLITDDDDGWSNSRTTNPDDEDDVPVVSGTSAEFKKAKKSVWKTVASVQQPKPTDEDAAADAILASAALERKAAGADDDDDPTEPTNPSEDADNDIVKMADGTHAGLQSASALTAQLKRRQKAEQEELERLRAEQTAGTVEEPELVLRDATGKRIDISMRRAELRRQVAEAEKQEEAKRRLLKGDVQQEEAKRRKEQLEDAALMPLARGIDDEELNRELKEQQRWNDPMAQFLTHDDGGGGGAKGNKQKGGGTTKSRRPIYKGAAPPNRYSIRPGYRWDGVDRSNGFEAERFKAINRRERNKGLEYSWQMDE